MSGLVNHPPHYTSHASGIECITLTEGMSFCRGNAFKYLFRHSIKGTSKQDLEKARWYINRILEIGHDSPLELNPSVTQSFLMSEPSNDISKALAVLLMRRPDQLDFRVALTHLNKAIAEVQP